MKRSKLKHDRNGMKYSNIETLENQLKTPKLENGDYGDPVRILKKITKNTRTL